MTRYHEVMLMKALVAMYQPGKRFKSFFGTSDRHSINAISQPINQIMHIVFNIFLVVCVDY